MGVSRSKCEVIIFPSCESREKTKSTSWPRPDIYCGFMLPPPDDGIDHTCDQGEAPGTQEHEHEKAGDICDDLIPRRDGAYDVRDLL